LVLLEVAIMHPRTTRTLSRLHPKIQGIDDAAACTRLHFSLSRYGALSFCLSMSFSQNRFPLLRDMLYAVSMGKPT
jgi:hypothetical protein